jgi:hypothetical protein
MSYLGRAVKNIRKRNIAVAVAALLAASGGAAFAAASGGSSGQSATFALSAKFAGFGVGYATTGASQVQGDSGGSTGSDCSAVNTDASHATLAAPPGAKPVTAFLYWVGLEQNEARGYASERRIDPDVQLTRSNGASVAVNSSKRMVASGSFNGGDIQYASYQADVTAFIGTSMSDTYEVAITGGIPDLCGLSGENARAWQLVVVYDTLSPDYSIVYLYDGLEYLQHQTRSITIAGFDGRDDQPSTLTAFIAQGDSNLPGEFTTNSDPSFPDFAENFAHESVNGGAIGANGQAVDIATLTGPITNGTQSLTFKFGTNQDVIVPTSFVLRISSNAPALPPSTTVPGTTIPAAATSIAGPTTTGPLSTVPLPGTTVAPPTTTGAPTTPTTTTPTATTTVVVVGTVETAAVPIAPT